MSFVVVKLFKIAFDCTLGRVARDEVGFKLEVNSRVVGLLLGGFICEVKESTYDVFLFDESIEKSPVSWFKKRFSRRSRTLQFISKDSKSFLIVFVKTGDF